MLKNVALFFISLFFLFAAIVWNSRVQHRFSTSSLHQQVAFLLNQEMKQLKQEADRIKYDSEILWSSLKYPFFLIENDSIKKWSQTNVVIQAADIREPFEWKFSHTSTSDFILYKKEWKHSVFLVGVLILKKGYSIENRYLTAEWNKDIFPSGTAEIAPVPNNNFLPVQVEGLQFGLRLTNDTYPENITSVGLVAGSIFFFLLLIYRISKKLHFQKKFLSNFLFISGALVLLRISMVSFSFPARWIKSDFFNPRYFASSSFNASAGDFLLNTLIVVISCGYLFFNIRPIVLSSTHSFTPPKKIIVFTIFITASYFAFLFPNLFVEAIFHDSALSFDITTAAPFSALRILVILTFALGCLSSFFVVVTFFRFIKSGTNTIQFLATIFLGSFLFLFYFIFSELNYWPTFWAGTILFLYLFFSSTIDLLTKIEYKTFFPVLIIISCYAAQSAWATYQFSEEKKRKSMFRASNELIASDVLAEYLVAQAIPRIANTSFAFLKNNLPLAYQEKQRITSILSNEYLDRYKITIYLFYADGRPVESTQVDDFSTAIKVIEKQSVKTNYEGVYLLQRRNAADVRHYVAVIPIKKNEKVQGLSLIHLSLARIFSDRVYPELTLDNRFARSIRNNDFSYAFYNQTSLLDQFGEMNFKQDVDSTLLRNKDIYDKGKTVNNYWVVAAEDETGRKVVVAARKASLFNLAANFSFIFVLGIILSFLFFAVSFLRRGFRHRSMDYSTRIQFLAYLFFILPLLAVSIISLRMLTQSNEAEQEKEMSDKGIHLTERLSSFLDNDSLKQKSGADNKKIKLIIASSEMDINIYDTSGKLLGTNQSSIFENQLVMPLLNRQAWENIVAQQHHSLLLKNNIGTLEYNSRYFAIYNTRHVLSGILELPFFTSSTEALKINLITNILVTFVVVFILFSFIAETAIKKITSPLRLIANRLNETKLTENKPIEWKNNDEIGMLVTEYNKMIDNLTISRNELARTQKESAWREIAQQVAHEIKNPLTPMKLTLQHLEQLMKQNSFDKIRVEKSLQTLLEQLQILNDIAGSFSSFASLPMPVITTVNLTDLMQRTVLFFQNHTLGNVFFHSSGHPLLVEADELLLSRIFSNIILNALQSRNGNGLVNVEIETTKEDKFVVVSIKDNGTGIDTALIDRIFLPHFTTKKSGSGLGLAIAKRSLEQMGGEIWFDTSARGTTFFVRVAV